MNTPEEIVEEVLYSLDDCHYSYDFKADRIIAALDEAGYIKGRK